MAKETKEALKLKLKDLSELKPEFPKVFTKITCPSCSNDVPADNININDKIAKCNSCAVVFPYNTAIVKFEQNNKPKEEVKRPEGIDLFEFKEELDISMKQPVTITDIFPLMFAFLGAFIFLMLFIKEGFSFWWPAFFGVGTIYGIFNLIDRPNHRIFINITKKNLTIRWHPKKFMKDRSFDIQDVDQLYVQETGGSYRVVMMVNGVDGQKKVNVTPYMSNKSKARYLEQEIERYLNIEDRKIPEEAE